MESIYTDLKKEIKRAESKFSDYNSPHEGYAVILEEVDELWSEVKKHNHDYGAMYNESIQIACTAIRFCKMIVARQNKNKT